MKIFVLVIVIIFAVIFLLIFAFQKGVIWQIFHPQKVLYLTFDDGPQENLTRKILDILRQEDVKATFFCVGDCARRHPELLQAIRNEGHAIGNHTMHHLKGWKTPYKTYIADVEEAEQWLNSRFFRPPYGKISLRQYLQLKKNYQIIFWTAISYDWDRQLSPQQCLHKVEAAARRGGIVVFHDNPKAEKNMLEALPRFIRMAKEKGMTFKTFEDR